MLANYRNDLSITKITEIYQTKTLSTSIKTKTKTVRDIL